MQIRNLESLSSNKKRYRILSVLPRIFEQLDPEAVCRQKADSIRSGLGARNVYVIGFGKASMKMYRGIRGSLDGMIAGGAIIVPEDESVDAEFPELLVMRGTHPHTGDRSAESTGKVIRFLERLGNDDTLIVLISGGGSALFERPVEGIGVSELDTAAMCLMNADADIYELNTFRKFFSKVKGGKLLQYIRASSVISLVVSDVFGDDLATIASGPLTFSDYREEELASLIEKFGSACPMIRNMIERAAPLELDRTSFSRVRQEIVLSNRDYLQAFSEIFKSWNEDHVDFGSSVNGEVEEVADKIARMLSEESRKRKDGFWFSFGGETTVKVRGNGSGGRNQELCLRMLMKLRNHDFLFMSIGTDGIDGASPAMGGIVDSDLANELKDDEIRSYLENSDSYTLLNKYDSAIITGRTGTNVSDIAIGYFCFKPESGAR